MKKEDTVYVCVHVDWIGTILVLPQSRGIRVGKIVTRLKEEEVKDLGFEVFVVNSLEQLEDGLHITRYSTPEDLYEFLKNLRELYNDDTDMVEKLIDEYMEGFDEFLQNEELYQEAMKP